MFLMEGHSVTVKVKFGIVIHDEIQSQNEFWSQISDYEEML